MQTYLGIVLVSVLSLVLVAGGLIVGRWSAPQSIYSVHRMAKGAVVCADDRIIAGTDGRQFGLAQGRCPTEAEPVEFVGTPAPQAQAPVQVAPPPAAPVVAPAPAPTTLLPRK